MGDKNIKVNAPATRQNTWEKIDKILKRMADFIIKIVLPIALPIWVTLFVLYLSNKHNTRQIEISRDKHIAEIILKLGSEAITDKNAVVISLTVFKEHAIAPLLTFLTLPNTEIRKAAASSLMMIGNEVVQPLVQFIFSKFILNKYKGDAIILLEYLDKSEAKKVTAKVLQEMQKDKVKSSPSEISEVKSNTHPFICPETIIALHRLDADLSNTFLKNIDLSGINLAGIKFKGAHLEEANFQNSTLIKVDFSEAILSDANFVEADVTGADFIGANCKRATFEGAILRNADFSNAILYDAVFDNADISGVNFKGAKCEGATWKAIKGTPLHPCENNTSLLKPVSDISLKSG